MKKLIITADDFGKSEKVNAAIIKCFTSSAVTDISLLAVGDSFEHAVKLARENGITKVGVHLALTGSYKGTKFPKKYKTFFMKYFSRVISADNIYSEFKNQILKIKNAGFIITHINSHEHIHMVPGILKVAIKLMGEEDINYVRFPLEKISIKIKLTDPSAVVRNLMLSSVCNLSRGILDRSGVKHNDYFIGGARALRLKRNDFIDAISNLKDGLTELGCHPGMNEEEVEILCDKDFIDEIREHNIQLVSY